MNPTLRNILAVLAGLVIGIIVNGSIIAMSGAVIAFPEGYDPNDIESIKANIHLLESKHFIMPFLAHALGTLVGAFIAAKLAITNGAKFALGVGVFFLLGGIYMATIISGPTWFIAVDLLLAYIPMGILGGKLAGKR